MLKTIKNVPGYVQAMRFWLKNRENTRDKWQDNIALTDSEGNGFQLVIDEVLRPPTP
jgi:hypothetical protein